MAARSTYSDVERLSFTFVRVWQDEWDDEVGQDKCLAIVVPVVVVVMFDPLVRLHRGAVAEKCTSP